MAISVRFFEVILAVSSCLAGCTVDEQSWLFDSIPEVNWDSPTAVEAIIQDEILRIEPDTQ